MKWDIEVSVPARLHLGFVQPPGADGLGSLAVAIDRPVLRMHLGKTEKAESGGYYGGEMGSMLLSFLERFSLPGASVWVDEGIPRHSGLGSGTRMLTALGMGLSRIYGLDVSPQDIASFFGRAKYSKAGLHSMLNGGLAAALPGQEPETLLIPKNWCFAVAVPAEGKALHGEEEKEAMENITSRSFRLNFSLEELRNAVEDEDAGGMGKILDAVDASTGEWFSSGTHPRPNALDSPGREMLREYGALSTGQSSWGPAFYGFFSSVRDAEEATAGLKRLLARRGGDAFVARVGSGIEFR